MCLTCGQIIGPRSRWETDRAWTWCADPCAHSAVRWRDGDKGLLEVTAFHGEGDVAILGLHNGMVGMLSIKPEHEGWRNAHDKVTEAPGYLFDKSKRACWAVLVRPGESNDVFFMPYMDAYGERELSTGEKGSDQAAQVTGAVSCSCGKPFPEDGGAEGICECCSTCNTAGGAL